MCISIKRNRWANGKNKWHLYLKKLYKLYKWYNRWWRKIIMGKYSSTWKYIDRNNEKGIQVMDRYESIDINYVEIKK